MDTSPHKSDFVTVNGVRLHYLDWGGEGPVLLFLTGLGLSAHIYDRFAPRFTDKFRVLALTRRGHGDSDYPESGYDVDTLTEDVVQFMDALKIDKAILVGHSMANVELCHMSALHPERIIKLIFLDANYNRPSPAFKAIIAKNPLHSIPVPWIDEPQYNMQDYIAFVKRSFPSIAAIWSEVLDEDVLHSVKTDADGRIVDRMPESIGAALHATLSSYTSEDTSLRAPVLSFFADQPAEYFLSSEYMSAEQQAQVIEYFEVVRLPFYHQLIEQFRKDVPHAVIVKIPKGHHYCFLKQEELVYAEMRKFLLQ